MNTKIITTHQIQASTLMIHPGLENLPPITVEEKAALAESIQGMGIIEPLICTPDKLVYGGRARLEIAHEQEIFEVPVIFRPEPDVLGFALESRLVRGQLTKSGVALYLFKLHSHLADRPNMGGRPKKPSEVQTVSLKDGEDQSFTKLARQFRLDQNLFTSLIEARKKLTKSQWAELEKRVLVLQVPLGRAYAGIRGGVVMSEKGRQYPVYFPGWEDDGVWGTSLFSTSLQTVRNAITVYESSDRWIKERVKRDVAEFWSHLPRDVRKACMEADS